MDFSQLHLHVKGPEPFAIRPNTRKRVKSCKPRNLVSMGLIRFWLHEIKLLSFSNRFPVGAIRSQFDLNTNTNMKQNTSFKATTEIHVFYRF